MAPANIHLSELQVWEAVVGRELAKDMGEVDASGRPGGIEGHNPNHLGREVSGNTSNTVIQYQSDQQCHIHHPQLPTFVSLASSSARLLALKYVIFSGPLYVGSGSSIPFKVQIEAWICT